MNREAIKVLQFNAELADPELRDALDLAISALKKQSVDKCCETYKYKNRSAQKIPCCDCYMASCFEDCYEPYTEEDHD
jgi:hypothetical protein